MPKRPDFTRPSSWSSTVRRSVAGLTVVILVGAAFGLGWLLGGGDEQPQPEAAAPQVIVEEAPETEEPEEIGFPDFATRSTTRVGGADAIADAAGIALASYPSEGGIEGASAVVLASAESWQEALAATSLTADPFGAPLLLGAADSVPELTERALSDLDPTGLDSADGAQVIAIGDVQVPGRYESLEIKGGSPEEIAASIDAERTELVEADDPDHILVVSSTDAGAAMPAAAWAALSGDPILFADGDDVPKPTLEVIEEHPKTPVYVLGSEKTISDKALKEMGGKDKPPVRVGEDDPVENAIAFARFSDGDFGWNIQDPGHGFTIASTDRPLDAAAGAPLAVAGKPGPLLVTDDPDSVPPALRGFLLDTKPGFEGDPVRALYNHVWLLGDTEAISVAFQAQVDDLTELARVSTGSGVPKFAQPGGGSSDDEGEDKKDQEDGGDSSGDDKSSSGDGGSGDDPGSGGG